MLDRRRPSARRVHALLAAAMADPALLEDWRRNGAARRKSEVDAATFDLEAIWRFAGLANKVRHNDLRLDLPNTFKLLDAIGASVELFADYATQAAVLRNSGKKAKSDRMRSLCAFLETRLDRDNAAHALVWDMLRHETTILQLREGRSGASAPAVRTRRRRVGIRSVPVRRGRVMHHEMSCNLADLEAALAAGRDVTTLPRGSHHVAYCRRDGARRIHVVDLDELGAVLLDLADGRRSVADMAAMLRGAGISLVANDLQGAVEQLVAAQLLSIAPARNA